MTTTTPVPTTSAPSPDARHDRLWSWLMLPVAAVVWLMTGIAGFLLLPALGLHEGDLLMMQRGVLGWACELVLLALVMLPPAVGCWRGTRAVRHGMGSAWFPLALNVIVALLFAYQFVDAVLMTYWPGLRG